MRRLAHYIFPAGLNLATIGIGIFIITWFVSRFGQEAVAAYGIATRIEQIALLPTIGLNMATLSIVGQNFGAGFHLRIRDTVYTAVRYGFIFMVAGGIILFIFAAPLVGLFTSNPEVIQIGRVYLQIAVLIFWAYVMMFVMVSALQGMGKPIYAIWIGLYRQILAPIVIFYLFTEVFEFGLPGVWWGLFLITWSAALFTWYYIHRTMKNYRATSRS